MSFVTGRCVKCTNRTVINAGEHTREEVENFFKRVDFGECPAGGWHVEIGKMADYIEIDWSHSFNTQEEAKEYNQQQTVLGIAKEVVDEKAQEGAEALCQKN